jgi:serine/threonine-protein kinase RIO1
MSCRTQSVDLDHPRCFDFLKEDLTHVNDFFSRRGALAGVPCCAARKRLSPRRGTAQAWRPQQFASCLTL